MISRLSALAALFAIVTTASLAVAANVTQQHRHAAAAAASAPGDVIVLQRVVVNGHRTVSSN